MIVDPGEAPGTAQPGAHGTSAAAEQMRKLNEAGEEALLAESMRYNIDLAPQLLLCAGRMIEHLRESGVSNYLEFRPLGAHLYALQFVP